jgi:hypothetical protein
MYEILRHLLNGLNVLPDRVQLQDGFLHFGAEHSPLFAMPVTSVQQLTATQQEFVAPLWSSGRSFWLQIQRSRVRFPALPDFLRSRESGTGSTQPREDN